MNTLHVFVLVTWSFGVSSVVDCGNTGTDGVGDFVEICPKFWSRIRGSRITEFGTNCTRPLRPTTSKKHELLIHHNICLVVNSILRGICKTADDGGEAKFSQCLSSPPKTNPQCPIRMPESNVKEYFNLVYRNLSRLLGNRANCEKICYDVNEFEEQCSALMKVSECLNQFAAPINVTEALKETGRKVSLSASVPNAVFAGTKVDGPNRSEPNPGLIPSGKALARDGENEGVHAFGGGEIMQQGLVSGIEAKNDQGADVGQGKGSEQKALGRTSQELKKVTLAPPSSSVPSKGVTSQEGEDPLTSEDSQETVKPEFLDSPMENSEVKVKEEADENPEEFFMKKQSFQSSVDQSEIYSGRSYFQAEESHFFFYFLMFSSIVIIAYFAFHNKNKILAYALEGRSERRSGRRWPNPVKYKRLETNLEEVIGSSVPPASTSSVLY